MGELLVQVSGGTGLDNPNHFPDWALGWDRNENMNMVSFPVDLFDYEVWVEFNESFNGSFEVGQHALVQYLPSVFGRPHYVVVAQEY